MSLFLRIDINIAAFVVLGTVFAIACNRLDRQDVMNRKFMRTSLIILLELMFETVTCIINKRPEHFWIPVSYLVHMCLFVTGPIITYSLFTFVYGWITPNASISRRVRYILLIPVAVNSIITVLSPFFGWVFSVSSSNVYQRGPLFIVSAVIIYFYMVFGMALILRQKRKIIKQEFIPLFACGILPLIGGLGQTLFYGALLMWSCAAFSLVIVYTFLQQRMTHLDDLTGAYTRESFYRYVSQRVKQNGVDKFGAIYIDLDGLKQINDEYGHLEGDTAIKTTAQLIKSSLRKTDIVARLGGDEFVIIATCEAPEVLDSIIDRIDSRLVQYNMKSEKGYKLECSFGADIYNENYDSVEQFLHHVDKLMYSNKKGKTS